MIRFHSLRPVACALLVSCSGSLRSENLQEDESPAGGAIYRAGRNLSASMRVGTSVYGAYDWDDGGPTDYDGDLEPGALYLRLGIAWDF